MIPGEYEYQKDLQGSLSSCPHLRTMVDGVPGPDFFIYPFLETNLLQFSQNKLSDATRKDILKNIKPDNILLDYEIKDAAFHVKRVQIADLEDSVILPDGKHLKNTMCGNQLWRSPESWARAAQGTPSDIFSFGIVSLYVMLNDMVLRASNGELAASDAWRWVLRRQISFFAKEEEFKGLLKWIGEENPFSERLITLAGSFDFSENPRKPFEYWEFVDASFRDLIGKMTALDPGKRITAKDALMHSWFSAD
ncbi:serine/threonine protein kinase [Leptodontidium sp. 2 PMI_412]|nr:serine/threonine protein kinase [Leptodontidium sp. 2 PMI_412]